MKPAAFASPCSDDTLSDEPTVDVIDRAASTLAPPAPVSLVRYKSGAPVDELLYRLAMGDDAGALDAAQDVFDAGCIPILIPTLMGPIDLPLGYREELLLSCIDGSTPLEQVLSASGLDVLDALRALGELLEKDRVAVC